jgi:ABC-type glycerol-3-phosphate transport system substrate-binding protein
LFCLNFNEFIDMENQTANIDNEKFISLLETVGALGDKVSGWPALIHMYIVYSPAMTNSGTDDLSPMFHLTNDTGQALFAANGFMPAINANSAHVALAADFIRFLLTEEVMAAPEFWTAVVNRNATTELAKLTMDSVIAEGWIPEGYDDTWLDRNIAAFNALAEQASLVESSDFFIRDFLTADISRYFRGEQTAEQTARNLQTRLNTYLQE